MLNFYKIPSGTGVISSLRAKLRDLLKVTRLVLRSGAGSHTQTSIAESWSSHCFSQFPSAQTKHSCEPGPGPLSLPGVGQTSLGAFPIVPPSGLGKQPPWDNTGSPRWPGLFFTRQVGQTAAQTCSSHDSLIARAPPCLPSSSQKGCGNQLGGAELAKQPLRLLSLPAQTSAIWPLQFLLEQWT